MMAFFYKVHQGLLKIETGLLIGLLISLILLAIGQIILRNGFDSGLFWAESYIRISVLWMVLLGAMIGSRKQEHLAIDVFIHKLSEKNRRLITCFNQLLTAVFCFIIAYHSSLFVQSEYRDGGLAFSSIPNWLCELIIPLTFFVIACRYFIGMLFNLTQDRA
jgi:TRAP-type C4-dicarboxylate transport system permease small subunit